MTERVDRNRGIYREIDDMLKLRNETKSFISMLALSFLGGSTCSEEVLWLLFGGLSTVLLALDFKLWLVLVELHEFGEIELGLLEKLDLSDEDILEWEDLAALLLDLLSN
jgi:hypothetical protein